MLKLLTLGFVIWSFFQPAIASIVFLGFIALFEGWLLSTGIFGKRNIDAPKLTPSELDAFRKYYLYFRFPFASRSFSSTLSGIQLSTFLWVPWLLYNWLWLQAILIGLNYFIAARMAVKFNPRFFLHEAVERKEQLTLSAEMGAVDSICEKILEAQRSSTKGEVSKKQEM